MYALVLLLAMMIMSAWWRWVEHPTWQRGVLFIGLSIIGALTHYFLVFLWVAQGLMLLLAPRKTRSIRWTWLGTITTAGAVLLGLVMRSPGMRATMLSMLNIFPLRALRLEELKDLLLELTVMMIDPARLPMALTALGLTLLGWALRWLSAPAKGALLTTWGLVPIAILHFVPITLTTRYVLPAYPALILGMAAVFTLLRPHILRLGLAALVLIALPGQWQEVYRPLEATFSRQTDQLYAVACPGDAVVLNGPWPALLFRYYPHPPGLDRFQVPAQAPPGFDPEVDVPRLEKVVANHDRIWTFYGAIRSADPNYAVSRWFADHTYAVHTYKSMVLYLPSPPTMDELARDISFGDHLNLMRVTVDRKSVAVGEPIRVGLAWERQEPPSEPALTLALVDGNGHPWITEGFRTGPIHHTIDATLPDTWTDRRGLWLLPGIPPGTYTLALRVEAQDLQYPETIAGRWVPLGSIEVTPRLEERASECDPNLTDVLPNPSDLAATFGNALGILGLQPWDTQGMQGYPTGLRIWWEVHRVPEVARVRMRLRGPEIVEFSSEELAPDHYPFSAWNPGDVIQKEVVMQLPNDLPAGVYHVEAQVLDDQGICAVSGSRDALTFGEQWRGNRVILRGAWADLYTIEVDARDRDYKPPLVRQRRDVRFGDVLRLRGYRLSEDQLRPGETAELILYWEAIKQPSQIYAAFNHLHGQNDQFLWAEDSWPQQGLYTTDHWLKGEVVAETYTLRIPEHTPPGDYPLYVGIYDPSTGRRLSAVDQRGEAIPDNQVKLFDVEVIP